MGFDALVKATALTSAGLFAGYTWSLSDAAVPATLLASEATQAAQWQLIYLKGFYISRPLCLLNFLTFSYLAYHAQQPSSPLRALYILAALTNASGVPYALTLLRRTNGALAIRSDKLAGPPPEPWKDAIALTYAFDEQRSRKREKEWQTEGLVRRWQWHNALRTVVLVGGMFVGALAVAMDR